MKEWWSQKHDLISSSTCVTSPPSGDSSCGFLRTQQDTALTWCLYRKICCQWLQWSWSCIWCRNEISWSLDVTRLPTLLQQFCSSPWAFEKLEITATSQSNELLWYPGRCCKPHDIPRGTGYYIFHVKLSIYMLALLTSSKLCQLPTPVTVSTVWFIQTLVDNMEIEVPCPVTI